MEPIKAPPMESLANLTRQTEAVLAAGTNASEELGLGFGLVSTSVSDSFFEESIVAMSLSLSLGVALLVLEQRASLSLLVELKDGARYHQRCI